VSKFCATPPKSIERLKSWQESRKYSANRVIVRSDRRFLTSLGTGSAIPKTQIASGFHPLQWHRVYWALTIFHQRLPPRPEGFQSSPQRQKETYFTEHFPFFVQNRTGQSRSKELFLYFAILRWC